MSAKTLTLADDLKLPLDIITRRTAIVGQTDTGKTSTAVVLVEEAKRAGAQVVVIDPSGAWWGVTSPADDGDEEAALDMVVMGGEHGDVPLNEHAGAACARLVAEEGYSVVLDLDRPYFKSWGSRMRFVADFLSELYELARTQILVVIDEAHRFAPQAVREAMQEEGHAARSLGAVVDVVALGRRRGLAVVAITQRLAKLHKDVLELCEVFIAHRLRGTNDRKSAQGWLENAGEDVKAILAEVAGLEKGVARVSAPTMGIDGVYRIRMKSTFDSSRTIGPGESIAEPKHRAEVDLEALKERMAATIEEEKAKNPAALREEVERLKKQIAEGVDDGPQLQELSDELDAVRSERNLTQGELDDIAELLGLSKDGNHGAVRDRVGELASRPDVPEGLVDAAAQTVGILRANAAALRRDADGAEKQADWLETALQNPSTPPVTFEHAAGQSEGPVAPAAPESRPRKRGGPPGGADGDRPNGDRPPVKAGGKRILAVLLRYSPRAMSRKELATLVNFTSGGTMSDYLSVLRKRGLIAEHSKRIYPSPTLYLAEDFTRR